MAKRPKSHVLEDESRTAFRQRLEGPLGWVVRDVARDYGIDLEVEVFDDELTTGLTFKVQLKSVEKASPNGPYIDVAVERLKDWALFDAPVLIALWTKDSDLVHACWAHSVDRGPGKQTKKKHRVRFAAVDEVTHGAPWLRRDISAIRRFRAGQFSKPIPIRIGPGEFDPLDVSNQVIALIEEAGLGQLLQLVDEFESYSLELKYDVLRVALPVDLGSISLWRDQPVSDLRQTAADSLVALAALLARGSRYLEAAEIVSATMGLSHVAVADPVAWDLAAAVAQTSSRDLALAVFFIALECGHEDAAAAYLQTLRFLDVGSDSALVERLAAGISAHVDVLVGQGNVFLAARWAYNLAKLLMAWTEYDKERVEMAGVQVARAMSLDPNGYGQRADCFHLLGGISWWLGDYAASVDHYEKAVEMSGLAEAGSQLADALMHAGRYREAQRIVERVIAGGSTNWRDHFVHAVVTELADHLGVEIQERSPREDFPFNEANFDLGGVEGHIKTTDGLDPRAWALLAAQDAERVTTQAAAAFLSGSVLSWVATVMGLLHHGPLQAQSYLAEALRDNREARDALVAARPLATSLDKATADALDQVLLKSASPRRPEHEVRLVDRTNVPIVLHTPPQPQA